MCDNDMESVRSLVPEKVNDDVSVRERDSDIDCVCVSVSVGSSV